LPKGGGAIRGIGEKFSANPVTGTGAMSVPITLSPGRGGFGPQLSLSYDSGAGNRPFGLGWSLSLPTITRKTDKGLPRYRNGPIAEQRPQGSTLLPAWLSAGPTGHAMIMILAEHLVGSGIPCRYAAVVTAACV
jgi:hypothetical protein